ncbi:EAL domain-containing protein [Laribacter hongkongensis]|uniref:EAL domain-containing protein n=1 Tax=Laribacter hongkongensis TaxID=168471 RepID=UPI001EFEE89F|nr:EAL domain-containing protein [Laribacter hongkongensis]MCG9096202.1 EAL domain-containing protein [Laribacter hongkongensis]MCG9125913.1 EAL domain-containing protein [Laribacter hongkongensis]
MLTINGQLNIRLPLLRLILTVFLMIVFLALVVFLVSKHAEGEVSLLSENKISRIYPVLYDSMNSVEENVKLISLADSGGCEGFEKKRDQLVSKNLFLSEIYYVGKVDGDVRCALFFKEMDNYQWLRGGVSDLGWKWGMQTKSHKWELFYIWDVGNSYYGVAVVNIDLLKNILQIVSGGVTPKIYIKIGDGVIGYDGLEFNIMANEGGYARSVAVGSDEDVLSIAALSEMDFKNRLIVQSLSYVVPIVIIGIIILISIVVYFINNNMVFRRAVLHDIKNNNFIPFYQGIVDVDRKICAVEVLLRWKKNGVSLLGPISFIDRADKAGLLSPIVDRVMDRVLSELPNLGFPYGTVISVNLTPLQINDPCIFGRIEEFNTALVEMGYKCMVEVTEEGLMVDQLVAKDLIGKIRKIGVDVAIDDFGVGNSSLNYIQNYDFNVVKIDRSFIEGIEANDRNHSIVKGLVCMAKELGMNVVAEGVETEAQVEVLATLGIDKMQGFLFYKPFPAGGQ